MSFKGLSKQDSLKTRVVFDRLNEGSVENEVRIV